MNLVLSMVIQQKTIYVNKSVVLILKSLIHQRSRDCSLGPHFEKSADELTIIALETLTAQ